MAGSVAAKRRNGISNGVKYQSENGNGGVSAMGNRQSAGGIAESGSNQWQASANNQRRNQPAKAYHESGMAKEWRKKKKKK